MGNTFSKNKIHYLGGANKNDIGPIINSQVFIHDYLWLPGNVKCKVVHFRCVGDTWLIGNVKCKVVTPHNTLLHDSKMDKLIKEYQNVWDKELVSHFFFLSQVANIILMPLNMFGEKYRLRWIWSRNEPFSIESLLFFYVVIFGSSIVEEAFHSNLYHFLLNMFVNYD